MYILHKSFGIGKYNLSESGRLLGWIKRVAAERNDLLLVNQLCTTRSKICFC